MEPATMFVWVLLTVNTVHASPTLAYSPPLVSKAVCEELKSMVDFRLKAVDPRLKSYQSSNECIELKIAVPDSNARFRPLPKP